MAEDVDIPVAQRAPRQRRAAEVPRLALGVAEAAAASGVSETHLRTQIAEGKIPVAHIGGRIVIRLDTLDRWLAEREHLVTRKR